MNTLIQWLESHQQSCFYKKYFGIECPGCGMQRSFIELLKGNIWESLILYPALIPTLLMIGFLVIHLIYKFKNGGTYLKYLFIFNTTIVVLNYIYKLLTH
jgi:hypothetical protein